MSSERFNGSFNLYSFSLNVGAAASSLWLLCGFLLACLHDVTWYLDVSCYNRSLLSFVYNLCVCLSIYLYVYLFACLCFNVFIFLSFLCQSFFVSIYLCVYLSACLSICVSIYLSMYLSVCLFIFVSIYLCVSFCVRVFLSIFLSIFLFHFSLLRRRHFFFNALT